MAHEILHLGSCDDVLGAALICRTQVSSWEQILAKCDL